jgi:hypothetical protein
MFTCTIEVDDDEDDGEEGSEGPPPSPPPSTFTEDSLSQSYELFDINHLLFPSLSEV